MISAAIIAGISIFVLILESALRINDPAYPRPSTIITLCAAFISEWAYYIGQQIARFTDVWYIIKEIFGNDLKALGTAVYNLCKSPFYLGKGYIVYYLDSIMPADAAILAIVLVIIVISYYYRDCILAFGRTFSNETVDKQFSIIFFAITGLAAILSLFGPLLYSFFKRQTGIQ